jgi:hypothetical protein
MSSVESWLFDVLATNGVFTFFSMAALISTLVVAVGLYLEYEREVSSIRKKIGNILIVVGVVLEALFGLVAFISASTREYRAELRIAALTQKFTYRKLTKDEEQSFVAALKPYRGEKVDLMIRASDDPEPLIMFNELASLASSAGWKVAPIYVVTWNRAIEGVRVEVTNDAPARSREAAKVFAAVLGKWVATGELSQWKWPEIFIFAPTTSDALKAPIKVSVGTRPGLL